MNEKPVFYPVKGISPGDETLLLKFTIQAKNFFKSRSTDFQQGLL
jgi:hypothetical protein